MYMYMYTLARIMYTYEKLSSRINHSEGESQKKKQKFYR